MTTGLGTIQIFDPEKMAVIHEMQAHSSSVVCIDMDPFGATFASGGVEGVVGIFDTIDWTCVQSFDVEDQITSISFSYNKRYLAVGTFSSIAVFQVCLFLSLFHRSRLGNLSALSSEAGQHGYRGIHPRVSWRILGACMSAERSIPKETATSVEGTHIALIDRKGR